jgi:hypothetical protein
MNEPIVTYNAATQLPNIRIGVWFEDYTTAAQTWSPTEGLTLQEAILEAYQALSRPDRARVIMMRQLKSNEIAGHTEPLPVVEQDRIFVGIHAAAIAYCDRYNDGEDRDYKRLATLPYGSLKLNVADDCPPELADIIRTWAVQVQARRGESFQTAGNTSVILGAE